VQAERLATSRDGADRVVPLLSRRWTLDGGRVEMATLYKLTDLARSLDVPLSAMAEWADRNWQAVEAARQYWDRLA
jgi:hypothetical protein